MNVSVDVSNGLYYLVDHVIWFFDNSVIRVSPQMRFGLFSPLNFFLFYFVLFLSGTTHLLTLENKQRAVQIIQKLCRISTITVTLFCHYHFSSHLAGRREQAVEEIRRNRAKLGGISPSSLLYMHAIGSAKVFVHAQFVQDSGWGCLRQAGKQYERSCKQCTSSIAPVVISHFICTFIFSFLTFSKRFLVIGGRKHKLGCC